MKLVRLQLSILLLLTVASSTLLAQRTPEQHHNVRSGFYYDNGENQTVAHPFASRRERRALARNILRLLDLPTKLSSNGSVRMDVPASRFVRDVYGSVLRRQEVGLFKFTDTELKTIEDSDVILSYTAHPKLSEHQSRLTLQFDISETPKSSNAFDSELRVYVKPSINGTRKISLFDSQGLVDSTDLTNEGWIKLSTARVLRRWLSCSNCVRELYLSTVSLDNDDVFVIDEPQKQAFLVGYFVNLRKTPTQLKVPNLRADRSSKPLTPRYYLDDPYSHVKESPRRRKSSCTLHSLHVRFRELDFDRYIVEPEGYDARYCRGDCRFPLTASMNATNHALVQTLVHFVRPRLAPRVACAPREYEDLPVFYAKDGGTYVYKVYREMIVKRCGCC